MGRLLFLFVVVPAVELGLLIEIGSRFGTLPTLGLLIVTGVVGAALARRPGLGVLRRVPEEVAEGRVPASSLVDGVLILIAGALLMTPGVLTDAVGFLCLVPGARSLLKREIWRRVERAAREGRIEVRTYGSGFGPPGAAGPTLDLGPDSVRKSDDRGEPDA